MRLVTSGDVQLRYDHTLRPGAPALLLINALGTSLEMWDDQFEFLAERYELIRYDARGHGKSTPSLTAEVDMAQLAADALAVLNVCGVARAHVCGISLGGVTAMQIARYWPDRVLKLVLSNTAAHMPPRENWQARIDAVRAQGVAPTVEFVLTRWFTPDFLKNEPHRVERIRAMLLKADPHSYAACCAALRDMDLRNEIGAIGAKTMVIAGSHDAGTTPEHAAFIHAAIADSKLVTLNAAHLSNVERAAEFNAALEQFLLT